MSDAMNSFRVGVMIAINTPYFIGSITAIVLNLVIPLDLIDDVEVEIETKWHEEEEENLVDEEGGGNVKKIDSEDAVDETYETPAQGVDLEDSEDHAVVLSKSEEGST